MNELETRVSDLEEKVSLQIQINEEWLTNHKSNIETHCELIQGELDIRKSINEIWEAIGKINENISLIVERLK